MKITENFTYIGTQQNFERDSYLTLAEMKAVVDKRMPDIFTATCKETGKFYIYNKNNEVDETLGKWRELSLDGGDYVTKTYVDTEIAKKADITSIPSKVSELTNDSNYQTAEQISSTVTTEIAKVVANAPENFDTLKEMSDWIAGHENDASTMNSAISDNKTAITALQTDKADKSEIPTTVSELTDSADYAKKTDLHSHENKTVLDGITSTKISNWDSAKTHADSAHAPSNAQANVIETVKVNSTALEVSNKAVNVTVPTTVSELTDNADYAKKTDIPTTLPANGGNADTVNNHTVKSDVPADAVFTDTVLEINDEGTSETTVWSSSKIVSEITNEATARQNADTALQSALAFRKSYDFIVDSNETLLEWAECTNHSMKSVLVKSGEYTLDNKMINLLRAGTKFVFAEDGNKIKSNYFRGICATEDYGAIIIGLNVELSYSINAKDCYAFYEGMICYNCTGTCTSGGEGTGFYGCTCSNCTGTGTSTSSGKGYGFYNCTCSNCTGSSSTSRSGTCYGFYNCTCSNCTGSGGGAGSGGGYGFYGCTCSNCTGSGSASYGGGYGFFNCSYCSSCRAGKTASTTATWGGTNTYIDSDSCDYVAS